MIMGMISEFKEFAMKGNVVDLAVGVVIGAAFGKIVTTLVDKVIMPPIGLLIGGVDFSKWSLTLKEASLDAAGKEVPAVMLGIGEFINSLIQFTIIAFAIFMVVKAINRMRKPEAAAAPAEPTEDVLLLREIRDSLKK
jgi:large conductance mechanosensitive channel